MIPAPECPMPEMSQGRKVLKVGMTREDEDGWWIIESIDRDCGVVWGYIITNRHGNSDYVDAAKMEGDWHE